MASCGSCLEKRPQAVVRRIMSASGIPRWRYFAAVRARKGVRTASCRKRLGNVRKPLLPISMTVRDVAELGSLFYGRESEKERADGMTSCRSCLEKRPQAVAVFILARERLSCRGHFASVRAKKEARTTWHLAEVAWKNARKPLLPAFTSARDVTRWTPALQP